MEEYDVYVLDGCSKWMDSLPTREYDALAARIDLLAEQVRRHRVRRSTRSKVRGTRT
jgi:hypothetical protein